MVRLAVGLEDQPAVDHEVDPADTPDVDLGPHGQSEQMQTEPEERLQSALSIRPGEIDQPSGGPGEGAANPLPCCGGEFLLSPGGFVRGEEGLVAAAHTEVQQRGLDVDRAQRRGPVAVVRDVGALRMRETMLSAIEPRRTCPASAWRVNPSLCSSVPRATPPSRVMVSFAESMR